LWGVLPQGNGISWQGHLFGFVGGGLAAYLLARRSID
jgi:membrane associated rhomboid family serine protease